MPAGGGNDPDDGLCDNDLYKLAPSGCGAPDDDADGDDIADRYDKAKGVMIPARRRFVLR